MQRATIRQFDADRGVILREARHLAAAIDRYRQLGQPIGENALDMILPEPQHVIVAGRQVRDLERNVKVHGFVQLSLGQEAVGDSALVQDLASA